MAKATKIFMELKGTRTRATAWPRNALTADSNILYSPERSVPHMDLCASVNRQKENHWAIVCRFRNQGGTRGKKCRQRNRKIPGLRHHSRSKDRRNRRRRSASGKRRDGYRRELSDLFEAITFESTTVDQLSGPKLNLQTRYLGPQTLTYNNNNNNNIFYHTASTVGQVHSRPS